MRRSLLLHRHALWALPVYGLLAATWLMAQSGPPLNIETSGANEIQITWPPGTNFNVLEESVGLDGPDGWFDAPDAPSPLGLVMVHPKRVKRQSKAPQPSKHDL